MYHLVFQILHKVEKENERLSQPDNCPDSYYRLMRHCWKLRPSERPSFAQIKDTLSKVILDCEKVSYKSQ